MTYLLQYKALHALYIWSAVVMYPPPAKASFDTDLASHRKRCLLEPSLDHPTRYPVCARTP
jgi:hypothetical protein